MVEEIEQKEKKYKVIFRISSATYSNITIYPDEKIILYLPKYQNYNYLDKLQIKTKLESPENFLNENVFYLSSFKILTIFPSCS
jgi:hypothetical protein